MKSCRKPLTTGSGRHANRTVLRAAEAVTVSMLVVWQPLTAGPAHGAIAKECNGQAATITGTRFADRIVGTSHRDVIVAGPGPDRVYGRRGDDIICGGFGDDQVYAGWGTDRVFGGPGRDTLMDRSFDYNDLLHGGPGADFLFTSRRYSPDGGDWGQKLIGAGGADRIVAGSGVQAVLGGPGDDVLVSRFFSHRIAGGPGQDVLRVSLRGGVVSLVGDGDTVRAESGVEYINFSYVRAPGPVEVDLRSGYGKLLGATRGDRFVGTADHHPIFRATGTLGNDILLGTDRHEEGDFERRDYLVGRAGNDVLDGREGPDWLYGDEGDDQLDGGPGLDIAIGGPGMDTCINIEDFDFDGC